VTIFERLSQAIEREERAVLLTLIDGEPVGAHVLVVENGERYGHGVPDEIVAQAGELIRGHRNQIVEAGEVRVFAEVVAPPPRLLVYGAVDTAEALCAAAKLLGWHTIVADARPRFATRDRIPSADELIVAWPEEAFEQIGPDHATAFVVLTHDEKFDVPALQAALASEAFYIGALGSRTNQQRRRERLLEVGVAEDALDRISGPCGLDLGAESQSETALSILAEIVARRAGRDGGPLKTARQRIHAVVE
jgi:xanthine dehydrogenase accessory factor